MKMGKADHSEKRKPTMESTNRWSDARNIDIMHGSAALVKGETRASKITSGCTNAFARAGSFCLLHFLLVGAAKTATKVLLLPVKALS